jgi:uncharacterized protein (DUF2164 family)
VAHRRARGLALSDIRCATSPPLKMPKRDASNITLPDEERKRAIASIRRFFASELDSDIGDLKALLVLDYFLVEHAPAVYNQAIADAQTYLQERVADLESVCSYAEFPFFSPRK